MYLDISPELLTADVANYAFSVINPPPTTFFTSMTGFPFSPPGAARGGQGGSRESGSALRWSRAWTTAAPSACG